MSRSQTSWFACTMAARCAAHEASSTAAHARFSACLRRWRLRFPGILETLVTPSHSQVVPEPHSSMSSVPHAPVPQPPVAPQAPV
jgi:hypothetical protein